MIDEIRFEYSNVLVRKYDKSNEPVLSNSTPVKESLVKARITPKVETKLLAQAKPAPAKVLASAMPAPAKEPPKISPEMTHTEVPSITPVEDSYTKIMQFIELHKGTPRLDDACKLLGL